MALFDKEGTLLVLFILLALLLLARKLFPGQDVKFWSSQPSVGVGWGPLGWTMGTIQSAIKTYQWVFEGYERFSKHNVPYILPSVEREAVVVIPPQQIMKVYGHPESILNVHGTQNESIQARWTIGDPLIIHKTLHINVIRNQMTRNLTKLTPRIAEGLAVAFDKCFGRSTEWKDVLVWESCLNIVSRASNGAFCGVPLCHDEAFLQDLKNHSTFFIFGAMAINVTPRLLQPLTGALVGFRLKYLVARCLNKCLPVIEERLEKTAQMMRNPSFNWQAPSDGLQWLIDEAYATKDSAQLEPHRIAHRLLIVNDVSFLSTSATMQNLLLDLASSDPSRGYIEALRNECDQAIKDAQGTWSKCAVDQLKLVDSAIRESMRLTPFGTLGLPRRVVAPEGIELDDNIRIPQNTIIVTPLQPIHLDEKLYPNAHDFDAFRFTRPASLQNVFNNISSREGSGRTLKSKSSVTLDDSFLGFGFGKHACPGRFFALNEMKLFVAHLVQNYDIEHLKERPKPRNFLWYKLPSERAVLRVRRRQGV